MGREKVKSPSREELGVLVDSVGGEAALLRILVRFYETLSQDVMIGFFFAGRDLQGIARKQSEFMLLAAGRIPEFTGKGPATAHASLAPILSGHFDRRLVLLRQVLLAEGVEPDSIEKWVSFEESFRAVVAR